MLTDLSLTKTYKTKGQPNQQTDNIPNDTEPYVNPIIKHTLQSLPLIYGGNQNRKRKYNMFMKNKFELNNIFSRVHNRNYLPNQRLYKKLNNLQQQPERGYSCLQINQNKDKTSDQRELIAKTATKKTKRIKTSPDNFSVGHQKVDQTDMTTKNKKIISLESVNLLAKPRDRCNKQYCSCKSFYEQYQKEINKKMREKFQILSQSKLNAQKFHLPRLYNQTGRTSPSKLDDQESRHKVSFRHKINSMGEREQNRDNCCSLCKKEKQQTQKSGSRGILGLIKKKQLEQKRNKLAFYSRSQEIEISFASDKNESEVEPGNQDFGIQANLVTTEKKLKTIDQEMNTEYYEEQSRDFKHLQNNTSLKDYEFINIKQSQIKQIKKQPMEHLSHLKEKYKYKKRPSYQPKYEQNSDQQNDQTNQNNSQITQDQKNKTTNIQKQSKKKKKHRQTQPDLNTSIESVMSENSMVNHLADALAMDGKDKSTIFKLLKNKQAQQFERNAEEGKAKNKNRFSKYKKENKNMNLIDESTGLFSIPEQQEYVDYLKNYEPIQKDFKIKNLVKSQNFKILKYKDTLYFGQAESDNTKHGKALIISPKQIFEGIYQNGIKMSGCQRNIDGIYMGEFLNGLRHGNGKWIWNNGEVYEGQWKLGTKNGYGVWKSPKGDSYEGEWVLNRQQGKGIHKHKNSVYQGEFIQALKQGQGRQKYINGDEYIGQYYKGRPHGKGKYIWKNGVYYEGQFKDGLRSGYGKWCYSVKAYYEGEFQNDFKHGKGKQVFANGDQYQGQYYKGQKMIGTYIQFGTGIVRQVKSQKKAVKQQEKIPQSPKAKKRQRRQMSDLSPKENRANQQDKDVKKSKIQQTQGPKQR